ncbi:MAG: hypothetical protein RL372_1222 [Bacteroidota bacterium]|jgi:hypothetical protein
MAHHKHRTSSDCLNCGTIVAGKFCQQCGQENIEVKESFIQIVYHFIEDITHFDGKLIKTLKYLITKPGFLTKEYVTGKRASYIHPIRMYLFISAIFFLFIFSGEQKIVDVDTKQSNSSKIVFGDSTYGTIAAYDSAQSKLPKQKKDKWLTSKLIKQQILINNKYGNDQNKILDAVLENFKHNFSKILYLSLPIFAFFLWVLYKSNKSYYFADHMIFSIHLYCAYFIIIFIFTLLEIIVKFFTPSTGILDFIYFVSLLFYFYKAVRNYYGQSRKKTLLKFFLINVLNTFSFMFLFVVLILLSLFTI